MNASQPNHPPPFSLLSENWIPIIDTEGKTGTVSLRELILHAERYARIDAPSPLTTIALYRLVLAVLYRALRHFNTEDVAEWFFSGFPKEKLEAYFARYEARFNLFGEQPFLQVTDLENDPAFKPEWTADHWTRLASELGSSNTTLLYNIAKRLPQGRTDPTTPAEAARRLVAQQSFALGGLMKRNVGSTRAAPSFSAALTLPLGKNLLQTLCLNLVPDPQSEPAFWEKEPVSAAEIRQYLDTNQTLHPQGLAQLYAPLTRAIQLHPEQDAEGHWCVQRISFAGGLPLSDTIAQTNRTLDPMVAIRVTSSKDAPYTSQKLSTDHLGWRDLGALLPEPHNKSAVLDKKGNPVVTLTGSPPRVLEHARHVLRLIEDTAQAPITPPETIDWDNMDDFESMPPPRTQQGTVLPICVIGQICDKTKILAIRQEEYTLPHVFIEDPQRFTDQIYTVLEDAKTVAGGLDSAISRLVKETLSYGREVEIRISDVRNVMNSIEADGLYWSRLEAPFRQYLAEVDIDPTQAQQHWQESVRDAAEQAWQTAIRGVGQSGASLRALAKAEPLLHTALKTFQPVQQGANP